MEYLRRRGKSKLLLNDIVSTQRYHEEDAYKDISLNRAKSRDENRNVPKKLAVTVRAISFPASCCGESDKRWREYMAGIAETNKIPIPPAAKRSDLFRD
jgi:hypothetical protein